MNSCIGSLSKISAEGAIKKAKEFGGLKGMDLAKVVSTEDDYKWNEGIWPEVKKSKNSYSVVAYDYGIKENILRLLSEHVGEVKVVNAKTPFEKIMKSNPQGIFLSNGPGDPEPCDYAIRNIKKFLEKKIPIFWYLSWPSITSISWWGKNIQNEIWSSRCKSSCTRC